MFCIGHNIIYNMEYCWFIFEIVRFDLDGVENFNKFLEQNNC